MKKFFKMSALALFGGLLALTSCADFRSDINDLNNRLDALETGKIADLESQIKSMSDALGKAQSAIDALKALGIEDMKDQLDDLQETIDGIDLSKYATLDYVNGTFATLDDIKDLNELLGLLEGRIKDLEDLNEGESISEILDTIADIEETLSSALGDIKSLKDALGIYFEKGLLESTINDIQNALDEKLDIADFEERLNEALEAAFEDQGWISEAIAEALNDAVSEMMDKINALFAGRLTSVSLIPELYVDGTPTIPFYTIIYNAKELYTTPGNPENHGEEYASEIPNIDLRNVSLKNTVARYHVSPDGLSKSDIGTPEYLIEEVFDLKSESNPFFTIESYDFVGDEFHVQLKKNTTDGFVLDNPFANIVHTAALKIPIAEKHLVEGEESAAVYSEYSKIGEWPTNVNIASLYDLNKNQTSGEYECNIRDNQGQIIDEAHYHFYPSFTAAMQALPVKSNLYTENLDLYTLVTGCLYFGYNLEDVNDEYYNQYGDFWWNKEITKEELAELGFEFRFSIPEVYYPVGEFNTNQQEFGQIVDGHYLQPTVPGGHTNNRAAIGRTPVVRVELIDTNNDDAIVDVRYFRIIWVENEIPSTVIDEPVRTFEYILSCEDFQGRLTWDEINNLILSQIGPDGVSHSMFIDAYRGGYITLELAEGSRDIIFNEDNPLTPAIEGDVVINWDAPVSSATSVFTWDLDIERIGNVIDDLLAGKEVKFGVTVTVHPNAGALTYAGNQTFTVYMVVKLPLLPTLTGVNEANWTLPRELARIAPVLYKQHDPNIDNTVYYMYLLNQLFNPDGTGLFVTNIVPTQDQINAAKLEKKANGEDRDLDSEWKCRGYDIVYEQNQVGAVCDYYGPYSPNYYMNNLHQLIANTFNAASNITALYTNEDIKPWLRTNDTLWLDLESPRVPVEEAKCLLNRNRTKDVAIEHYQNGVTKREDIARFGKDFKYVTFDIISRINPYNLYKVHTFDAWFVSPLAIDVTVNGKFYDQTIGGSAVDVYNAFDATKDFNDEKVALRPSTGLPEELRQYYDVKAPIWDTENALVSMKLVNGDLVVDNTLDANIESDRAQMMSIKQLNELKKVNIRIEYVENEVDNTYKLVFYADHGWVVEQDVNTWIPVVVEHKWGKDTIWTDIPLISTMNY